MTFRPAPLALDGASTPAALQRKGNFAGLGGAEGIIERTHMKVTKLAKYECLASQPCNS